MHSLQYTVHSTGTIYLHSKCTVYSTQFTVQELCFYTVNMHSLQYTVHSVQHTVYSTGTIYLHSKFKVYSTQFTVHSK